ncbi:unnamed protein product [Phaedon cochleariae]|uniref:Major facilitator superfamily (MFS) profile domain-containing protein n=1 Tax=Phaedon cochleariae TaxID=80249 RepID=A0A9P0DIJ2_PHACE|nr:unnamed protein product [Phaedon cochleariae]
MKVSTFGSDSSEKSDFDNAICLTGYGRFHYQIIAVCALSILVVGFQNGILSYIFPAAQCELHLTSFQQGLLNVAFLAGGTISCFVWGILADMVGRRSVLIATHLLNASVTILMSTNPYTGSLVACRFLNGFFIGGPGSIIYSYFAEFQPPKYRTSSVCYCGLFFTVAWLLLPLLAHLVLPLTIEVTVGSLFVLTPWRLFLILVALPEILVGLWLIRMPESPKFYVAKGCPRKALVVLRRMYATNSGRSPEYFPVKNLITERNNEIGSGDKMMCQGRVARVLKEMGQQAKSLFVPPLLGITVLTSSIMFANMFGMFGLGLWLPELFIRFEQFQTLHPNASISVRELSSLPPPSKNLSCSPSLDASVIRSTVAMGVTSLLFNGLASYVSTKTTARVITMVTMLLGGVSAGLIYWMRSSMQNLVLACVFQATMIASNMSTAGIAVDLFPTKVNGIAVCMVVCAGRIGAVVSNFVFGFLMDKNCELPIFIVTAVVILGGCLCFVVPIPKNREVIDMASSFGKNDMEISVVSGKFR